MMEYQELPSSTTAMAGLAQMAAQMESLSEHCWALADGMDQDPERDEWLEQRAGLFYSAMEILNDSAERIKAVLTVLYGSDVVPASYRQLIEALCLEGIPDAALQRARHRREEEC